MHFFAIVVVLSLLLRSLNWHFVSIHNEYSSIECVIQNTNAYICIVLCCASQWQSKLCRIRFGQNSHYAIRILIDRRLTLSEHEFECLDGKGCVKHEGAHAPII